MVESSCIPTRARYGRAWLARRVDRTPRAGNLHIARFGDSGYGAFTPHSRGGSVEEQLDPNKIAAEYLRLCTLDALKGAASLAERLTGRLRAQLAHTWDGYVSELVSRFTSSKSFLLRQEARPLHTFYVPVGVAHGDRHYDSPGPADLERISPRLVVTGSAGSGKTLFMKHILLRALASRTRVPVFVELRRLNESSRSLEQIVVDTLIAGGLKLERPAIEHGFRSWPLLILLDGFDEIEPMERFRNAQAISALAHLCPNSSLVVSSRPEDEFGGWDEFVVLSMLPLSLGQACELVAKSPFDGDVRARFNTDLRSGLFATHESFLSNPLLLSIMLLTYTETASVPPKMSLFYEQAYEALFYRFDALKAGFRRQRRCPLDIREFASVFSAFCITSHDEHKYEFSRSQAMSLVRDAARLVGLEVDPSGYLDDLLEAVCLLVEDGRVITFPHRAFQEYFAARFVSDAPPDIQPRLVERFSPTFVHDDALALLNEMKPDIIQTYYLVPGLRRINALTTPPGDETYARFLEVAFDEVRVAPDGITARPREAFKGLFDLARFVLLRMPQLLGASQSPTSQAIFNEARRSAPRDGTALVLSPGSEGWRRRCAESSLIADLRAAPWAFGESELERLRAIEELLLMRRQATRESLVSLIGWTSPSDRAQTQAVAENSPSSSNP